MKISGDRVFYTYQLRVEDEILPFYVGKGKGRRAWIHLKPSKTKNHKNNKIRKAQELGKQVLVEILRKDITEKQAHRLEKFWIAKIGRADLGLGPLTNCTDGGEGTTGIIWSDERKTQNGILKRQMRHSVETRKRMSEAHKGITHSDETKKKMSEMRKKEKHPLWGKRHSDEVKYKISESLAKVWEITYPDGKIEIISNLAKFCRENGLHAPPMRRVSDNLQDNHKGYKCKLINKETNYAAN